jgi:Domain of unknown function (DUF1905)/Bacteriocin-protection, YdeI or OmpD-Associated
MIRFETTLRKFGKKGEKTGWTYISLSAHQAQQLKPDTKTSFRVRGKLDSLSVAGLALIPMGKGDFILAVNAQIRKKLGKENGDRIKAELEFDAKEPVISSDLIKCLREEPQALQYFKSLPKSHRHYFSKWIEDAKTSATKTKRIVQAVMALSGRQGFGEMIRAAKNERRF